MGVCHRCWRVEQLGERLRQVAALHLTIPPDVQLAEQPLVDLSSDLRRCGHVPLFAVGGHGQRSGQRVIQLTQRLGCPLDGLLGFGGLSGDTHHFALHQVERYGIGIMRLEQLLAFAAKSLQQLSRPEGC
ncbi:hypothetical protein [Actinomadura sp. 3N508]|uniref:hypothetical protein n=1 Tax=Actinomadura sp. 3N508 TaxID=3375153 RepID=UPI0037B031E1